jgi:hypothetical protein
MLKMTKACGRHLNSNVKVRVSSACTAEEATAILEKHPQNLVITAFIPGTVRIELLKKARVDVPTRRL